MKKYLDKKAKKADKKLRDMKKNRRDRWQLKEVA